MKAAILAGILVLVGCAHVPVQDMGHGRHSLTATADTGGFAGSREEAIELANDYCARAGQQALIDGFYDKSGIGPLGEHTSSILFRCTVPKALHF